MQIIFHRMDIDLACDIFGDSPVIESGLSKCMIRQLHYLGLLLPLFTTSSWAAEQNSSVHIAPAGSHTAVYGSAENFIGRVRVFGFALTANAALINKGVTEMNHEYTVSDTLSARQQVIPLIAASMASSQMDKLNAALNQGLDAGLTINEAKEILIQLYAYTGFPRSLNALNELMKVVETRKQRGIEDIEGKAPIARIPVGDELRRVGTANQTKISGAPVQGPLFDFAPTINQFLQTHLFGDIFARDNLDWQSRELATVGALAATPGVEAQLLSHTRASLRVGLTAAQLRQLAQVLREHGDNDAATRADEALQKALENK